MNTKEMYETIGSNYDEVIGRLMSERLIRKLLAKYPNDENFNKLQEAVAAKDLDGAFAAVHSMKGISLNLGFDKLAELTVKLTEILRAKQTEGIDELFEQIKIRQEEVLNAISQLDDATS